eukprot:Gb_33787 [translate_table: standard]
MVMWKEDYKASTIYKDEKGRCLIIQFKEAARISDHCPIMFQETTDSSWLKARNVPFKLNITYLKDKDFLKNIHDWWKDLADYHKEEASPAIKWVKILKDLKDHIKEWEKLRTINLREGKEKVIQNLGQAQALVDQFGRSDQLKKRLRELTENL